MYAPPFSPPRVLLLCLLLALSACSDGTPEPVFGNATAVSVEGYPLPPLFEHALYELRYSANLAARERLYRPDGKGGFFFEDILHAQQPYPGVVDSYVESEQPELEVYFVVHWPSVGDDALDGPLEHAAGRLLGEAVGAFAMSALPRGGFGKTPEKTETEYAKEHPTWYLPIHPVMISYEFNETPGGAISVNFRSWSYGGGAHDNWTYTSCNLRRHDDREIQLRDIFPTGESLAKAAGYFTEHGRVTYEGEEREPVIEVAPDEIAMERLILVPQGLDILFDPYEKAGFADGDIRLRIPLSEFTALGLNDELWRAPNRTE